MYLDVSVSYKAVEKLSGIRKWMGIAPKHLSPVLTSDTSTSISIRVGITQA